MSEEDDSGSQSDCTTPQLLRAMSHPPPVSPQRFDAALLRSLVPLLTCLSSPFPSESRQAALYFSLCPPVPSTVPDALEALTNRLSDEWTQIKYRLTINPLQRMENSISGNCIEVIGSQIKLLNCLLDKWVSDFLGTLYNKWHIFDQSPEMWVYLSSVYWDPSTCPGLFSTWKRGTGKGRHNRRWDPSPVLKNILILMKRGRFRKLSSESFWHLKLAPTSQDKLAGI